MVDATFKVPMGSWLGARQKKSAFGNKKNALGLKQEHEDAILEDQARTDYLEQVDKDEVKANENRQIVEGNEKTAA
jgi:hypothetical protein